MSTKRSLESSDEKRGNSKRFKASPATSVTSPVQGVVARLFESMEAMPSKLIIVGLGSALKGVVDDNSLARPNFYATILKCIDSQITTLTGAMETGQVEAKYAILVDGMIARLETLKELLPAAHEGAKESCHTDVSRTRRLNPPLAQTENVIPRKSTVEALYEKLNRYRFILVRGTPASGKSTLAQLLLQHIREKEPEVQPIVISNWPEALPNWCERLGDQYDPDAPNTIVIDEAQLTYWDDAFWNNFLKSITFNSRDRIILFTGYGSPNYGVSKELASNIIVPDCNRISLQPVDHRDGYPSVGLFLLREEFNDMVEKLYPATYFKADFLDYVFRITAGHTGAVKDLLRVVQADESYRRLQRDDVEYSLEIFHRQFPIGKLWEGLHAESIFRCGLPYEYQLRDPSIARVFRAVRRHNYVTNEMLDSQEDQAALDECFKWGWLHATTDDSGEVLYIFATHLHQWFVEYFLGMDEIHRPPITDPDLPSFAIKVIQRFSSLRLSSTRAIIGASDAQRPMEARFQDEFYRCCHTYSEGSLISFPGFGNTSGKIALYLPLKQWGVQLLHDGEGLENYSSRFTGPGAYAKMEFQDYIILDFCTEQPQKEHPGVPKLYHVVFEENYSHVSILRGSSLERVTEFELLGSS